MLTRVVLTFLFASDTTCKMFRIEPPYPITELEPCFIVSNPNPVYVASYVMKSNTTIHSKENNKNDSSYSFHY